MKTSTESKNGSQFKVEYRNRRPYSNVECGLLVCPVIDGARNLGALGKKHELRTDNCSSSLLQGRLFFL